LTEDYDRKVTFNKIDASEDFQINKEQDNYDLKYFAFKDKGAESRVISIHSDKSIRVKKFNRQFLNIFKKDRIIS
jgi:hypothetical protein